MATHDTGAKPDEPVSPARTDGSTDSEGKPVREKLKETRIDAQPTRDTAQASDRPVGDTLANGTVAQAAHAGEQSASGSESERGRLHRKRSFEDFETDEGAGKPEKRHMRKRSREVTSPPIATDISAAKPARQPVSRIEEGDADESMDGANDKALSNSGKPTTPEDSTNGKTEGTVISPKNKRSREVYLEGQDESAQKAAEQDVALTEIPSDAQASTKTEEGRSPKRPRDKSDPELPAQGENGKPKISASSGFANTSAASPFASLSPSKPAPLSSTTKEAPTTSDDKFKQSGFSSFSSNSSSPFGSLGGAKPASGFASTTSTPTAPSLSFAPSSKPTGFAALAPQSGFGATSSTPAPTLGGSAFGSSTFGGKSGFGSFGAATGPSKGFGSGNGSLEIKGLKSTKAVPFGQGAEGSDAEDSDDEDQDSNEESDKDKRSEQDKRFHEVEVETGEEGEDTLWSGRAKLYTFDQAWKERGSGVFKLNASKDDHTKVRFVLRADGTHRLLLNAVVTKELKFGGDANGGEPTGMTLLFGSPSLDGKRIEAHQLKMKAERAKEIWQLVRGIQADL